MTLQNQSWGLMHDKKYHYQIKGKFLCNTKQNYVFCEEYNPPKKDRCKKCNQIRSAAIKERKE